MPQDRQALLDAVNNLVADDNPSVKLEALSAIASLRRRYPVNLTGELSVLNPLLDLESDPETLANVRALIDRKRDELGMPPCWPHVEARFDKNNYQRELMQQRRLRARAAVDVENAQRPEKDALRGSARLDFENYALAYWGAELQLRVDAARVAHGGKLTREQVTEIRDRYWSTVDEWLEEAQQLTRAEALKPAHSRKKIDVLKSMPKEA